jgi:tRNA(Ile)-lysidine synthase TilS/MesJ
MKRCAKCILPDNYPGVTFNEEGVCNHCVTYKERKYLGGEALKEKIESSLKTKKARNENYDCVLALSGGRDSSYLLYYLVKVLNLRVLAYCVDNGFIPEQTKQNLKNMVDILNVKLVIEKCDHLEKCIKHHILSWMHRPSPATVGMLCTGCRLGLDTRIPNFARHNKIPVIVSGATPFEGFSFKRRIMSINPSSRGNCFFILGYLSQILGNPRWVLNPTCLITQVKEYYYHFYRKEDRKKDLIKTAPFLSYIRWEEKEVTSRIENELKWRENPNTESSWRGDCDIAALKLYLYKKTLGFNDKDEGLSHLIRDGQISREEALKRLKKEGEIPEEVIKEIFDKLGLNFSDLRMALRQGLRKNAR